MKNQVNSSVVLIDDNPDDLFLARMVIQHASPQLDISEFSDPVSALSYFTKNPANGTRTVFLDINMPYLDGFEFLEQYAEAGLAKGGTDTIFLLTTSLHSQDRTRADANPLVKGFIRKPLTLELFADAMKESLG